MNGWAKLVFNYFPFAIIIVLVMKTADIADSKSASRKGLWIQFPSRT